VVVKPPVPVQSVNRWPGSGLAATGVQVPALRLGWDRVPDRVPPGPAVKVTVNAAGSTVRAAAALVTDPSELLTATLKFSPLMAKVVAGVV